MYTISIHLLRQGLPQTNCTLHKSHLALLAVSKPVLCDDHLTLHQRDKQIVIIYPPSLDQLRFYTQQYMHFFQYEVLVIPYTEQAP